MVFCATVLIADVLYSLDFSVVLWMTFKMCVYIIQITDTVYSYRLMFVVDADVSSCCSMHLHFFAFAFFVQFNLCFDGCILMPVFYFVFQGLHISWLFFSLAKDLNVENCRTQQNMEQSVRALIGLSAIQIVDKVRIILLTFLLAALKWQLLTCSIGNDIRKRVALLTSSVHFFTLKQSATFQSVKVWI